MNTFFVRHTILFLLIFCLVPNAQSQLTLSAEFQAYPTGIIPGIRIEKQLNDKTNLHLRVGMNIFDHRDLGVHNEEAGYGFGFTLGASRSIEWTG